MLNEPEIIALSKVNETLKGLNTDQIKRILDWAAGRFKLEKHQVLNSEETVEFTEAPVKKEKKRREPKDKKVILPAEEEKTKAEVPGITVFMKYDKFEDMFFASNAKLITAKILLAAAYLQENKKIKEFGSSDLSGMMKKIGQGQVKNIAASINVLLMRKPPLLIKIEKKGNRKHARRAYRVSEEGLRIAGNYIIETEEKE